MSAYLLRGAAVAGRGSEPVDIRTNGSRVDDVGPTLDVGAAELIDVSGCVVFAGLRDNHAHVDKTLWGGPWVPRTAAPGLAAAIDYGMRRRPELGIPSTHYIAALMHAMVSSGTCHTRTHVDVDPEVGLSGIRAVREAASQLTGHLAVDVVAFPQAGLLTRPGTHSLLDEALTDGADFVGGIDPAGYDGDAVAHLDAIFGLAQRHGVPIDIHLHDMGSLGVWELDLIVERTRALDMAGHVTVSHAFVLTDESVPTATRSRLTTDIAELDIQLACSSIKKPLPLRELAAEGVRVHLGLDGVRDLWSPYGNGDLLQHCSNLARSLGYTHDDEIERVLHMATGGSSIETGGDATLVAVEARALAEAVVTSPPRRLVMTNGDIVSDSRLL